MRLHNAFTSSVNFEQGIAKFDQTDVNTSLGAYFDIWCWWTLYRCSGISKL